MLNRISRLKTEVWTPFNEMHPSQSGSYTEPELIPYGKNDAISRMYEASFDCKCVERWLVGHKGLFVQITENNQDVIYSPDDNYIFQYRCKRSEFAKSPIAKEFMEKYKEELVVEKLTGEKRANIHDNYEEPKNIKISVTQGDVSYTFPTHTDYINLQQHTYYCILKDDEVVPIEIPYDQLPYFNNFEKKCTYINIPNTYMYIVYSPKDYYKDELQNQCILYLNNQMVDTNQDVTMSLEQIINKYNSKIKANILSQTIKPPQFVDLNNQDVEIYIDNM